MRSTFHGLSGPSGTSAAVRAYDAGVRSFSRLLTVALVVSIVASGCARKLTFLSSALATPAPPAHNLRVDTPATASNAEPAAVARPQAAKRDPRPPQAAPRGGQLAPAAMEPTPANALGTSGSSSVVSVRPDESASAVTVKTTTETSGGRKRQVVGATLVAAVLAAAFRFVPRRRL